MDGEIQNTEGVNPEYGKALNSLQQNESNFRIMFESSLDGLLIVTLGGQVCEVNASLCEMLGYTRDELLKLTRNDLIVITDPERQLGFKARNEHGKYSDLVKFKRKDGVIIETEISTSIFGGKDNETYTYVSIRDITERINAEIAIKELNHSLERKVEQRTAQLNEANKDLESFSYSVAHDLRAPLRVLNGYAKILLNDYRNKLGNEGKELLDVIMSRSVLMGQLITNMLEFAKINRVDISVQTTDLNEAVKEVIEIIRAADESVNTRIIVHELGSCNCDGGLIKQVWLNLISNAIKYSKKVNEPVVEVGVEQREGKPVYYVRDNGVGFDMQNAEKLFVVFQRLHSKTDFEGTGVGLAIAHRIVTRHGGKIWAEAKLNEGATFYFTLHSEN